MKEYTSPEGYTGQMYGESSFRIVDPYGKEVFHTYHRAFSTEEELKEQVDSFPAFAEKLFKYWKEHKQEDDLD